MLFDLKNLVANYKISEYNVQMQEQYPYVIRATVRDYECDVQGIVNNAVYLQYLEHARNTIVYNTNILGNLADLHQQGETPVVSRVEIDYKQSLHGQDTFEVRTTFQKKGTLRIVFLQHVYRIDDGVTHSTLVASAQTHVTILYQGKPIPIDSSRFCVLFEPSAHYTD